MKIGVEMRTTLPLIILFIVSVTLISDYYTTIPIVKTFSSEFLTWSVIITTFTLGLSALNLLVRYGRKVSKGTFEEKFYSGWALFVLIAASFIGIVFGPSSSYYTWLYSNTTALLSAAMYGIIGYYIVSASYRAIRATNLESTLFLVGCVLIILTNAPIGELIWTQFPVLGNWINTVPVMVVSRAFRITMALGAVFYGIRVLLGSDTTWMGGGKE